MFKEIKTGSGHHELETVIGPSVKIEGDFITEGNIVVEGIVSGTLKTAKNLRVGPNSKIFANVAAENALVAGEVQGNIKINGRMELTSSAKIFGDIKVGILIMASGATLNGKCQMGDNKNKSSKPEFSRQEKIELTSEQNIGEEKKPELKKKIKKT